MGHDGLLEQIMSLVTDNSLILHIYILGGTNLSPIKYCPLWEWAKEPMPPSRILHIYICGF